MRRDVGPDGALLRLLAEPPEERVIIDHLPEGVRIDRGSQRWFFPTTRALTVSEERTLGRLVAQHHAQVESGW